MIAALLSLALAPLTAQTATIDWSSLPELPYRAPPAMTDAMHSFAHAEARRRGCRTALTSDAGRSIRVDVAVLIDGAGTVRVAVPRAIACPTVEQYAAGLVMSFASNNLLPREERENRWYRTSLTFRRQQ